MIEKEPQVYAVLFFVQKNSILKIKEKTGG